MKNLLFILLIVFLITQILFLDFDNLLDWSVNKKNYISIFIALSCILAYQQEKKTVN